METAFTVGMLALIGALILFILSIVALIIKMIRDN